VRRQANVTVRKDHKGHEGKEPGARIQEPGGQGWTKRKCQGKVISRSVISIQKDPDRAYASALITDYRHFAVRRLHRPHTLLAPGFWILAPGSFLFVAFVIFPYCDIPYPLKRRTASEIRGIAAELSSCPPANIRRRDLRLLRRLAPDTQYQLTRRKIDSTERHRIREA
jgi:hypothetical protein